MSLLGVPLLILGLLVAASYPRYAIGFVAVTVVTAVLLQRGLAAFVRRTRNRTRAVLIPGVGTVRFRVIPR
jgi:membrane protein implicated in regulation of membrane protease activity